MAKPTFKAWIVGCVHARQYNEPCRLGTLAVCMHAHAMKRTLSRSSVDKAIISMHHSISEFFALFDFFHGSD
jgi:hypothetical protein